MYRILEFVNERRFLLEFVGPELQIVCEEYQIEVSLVKTNRVSIIIIYFSIRLN